MANGLREALGLLANRHGGKVVYGIELTVSGPRHTEKSF